MNILPAFWRKLPPPAKIILGVAPLMAEPMVTSLVEVRV
jgi:hypothetical protein